MSETQLAPDLLSSPYYLKRMGEFEKALDAYALRFESAQENGNRSLSEICFDQIFDVLLLIYLKQMKTFPDVEHLKGQLETDLNDLLTKRRSLRSQSYEKLFGDCWRRYSPRRGGQTRFSVDRLALLPRDRLKKE